MIKYMKHNIKNNFDVTVVGCGPAGAQVAKKLSDAGKSVLVLDHRSEIGDLSLIHI